MPNASQILVSIHAPTWGATKEVSALRRLIEFQSTHPRGVRLLSTSYRPRCRSFNPRTHVGCDRKAESLSYDRQLFQSTHPRGVRLSTPTNPTFSQGVSIHAPTWGATERRAGQRNATNVSIHAPTWGATLSHGKPPLTKSFQSVRHHHVGCQDP